MACKKTRSEEYAGGFPPGMEAFENLNDPCTGKAKRHDFGEVLFIALATMVCGMEGSEDFERCAQLKESWLRRVLKLSHGPPSDDTSRRIFTALDPKDFVESFIAHVRAIRCDLAGGLIAIGGKTLRHSFDHGDPDSSLHLISAWADGSGLTLGQMLVDGRTNEITAVPNLLRQLDVRGALDYGKAKGRQVNHQDPGPEKSHGRIEHRVLDWFEPAERKHWLGLRSLVEITSTRQIKGETSIEKRLTSHAPDAELLDSPVRCHWGIENRCHWVLDMTFDEDHCRIRKGHAAKNLALLRKLTLNLLRQDQAIKDAMRGKRIRAALCEKTLESLMKLDIST